MLKELLQDVSAYCTTGYAVEVSCEIVPAKEVTAQEIYNELAGTMVNAGYDAATTDTITPEQIGVEFNVSAAQKKLDETEPGETVLLGAAVENLIEHLAKPYHQFAVSKCKLQVALSILSFVFK